MKLLLNSTGLNWSTGPILDWMECHGLESRAKHCLQCESVIGGNIGTHILMEQQQLKIRRHAVDRKPK